MGWFDDMVGRCLDLAQQAKAAGHPVVGILCEYTPREIILAAGGVPVCLCGGAAEMVAPAEAHLPTNLCPLIRSTYGYHLTKANPFLEMADLLVAETTCDGKKKMYELLSEQRPMYVLDLPQKEDDPDALAHWERELRKLKATLERRWHVRVTAPKLHEAIRAMNRERALRRKLAGLMRSPQPVLTGRELLELKSLISGLPEVHAAFVEVLARLRARAASAIPDGRVRVLLTGVPLPHGAERVLSLIERHGGLVVCQENCTGLKPLLEDVDARACDPLRTLARKYFHLPCSVLTRNERRLESLRQLAREYRPQCVVELVWQACLTYDVESYRVRRFVEQELELPYLKLETDYSPSDTARIATRLEALFEGVRSRRGKRRP